MRLQVYPLPREPTFANYGKYGAPVQIWAPSGQTY